MEGHSLGDLVLVTVIGWKVEAGVRNFRWQVNLFDPPSLVIVRVAVSDAVAEPTSSLIVAIAEMGRDT